MGVPRVAPTASNHCPLVCETSTDGENARMSATGKRGRRSLMQTLRNLPQEIGIAGLYRHAVSFAGHRSDNPVHQLSEAGPHSRLGTRSTPSYQVGVNCHKVTTLHGPVYYGAEPLGQEDSMAERVPDTPRVQFASDSEKTFTRQPHDTLRSHLSCIGARGVPHIYGATHASAG
jgi:hypothetical protein